MAYFRGSEILKQARNQLIRFFALIAVLGLSASCTTELTDCGGAELPIGSLEMIRKGAAGQSGPLANLLLPNPIDVTGSTQVFASDSRLQGFAKGLILPDLLSSNSLQNNFLKIRRHSVNESASSLATPNSSGAYDYPVDDPRYSEAMAYYSVVSMMKYIQALGFTTVQTRPLFVLVQSRFDNEVPSDEEVNAYYEHNYLSPESPRVMRLIGEGEFAPGIDRDMYWHEFGHLNNESVTGERGFDFAGDNGAFFSEGAAMHECMADYLAQSVKGKPYIGRWIAKNFPEIADGQPLRWAVDTANDKRTFQQVSLADGQGYTPERYDMAEWCTRVMWQIRQTIVDEDPETGAIYADRLLFAAMSLLQRDASMQQFAQAIETADKQLHCGIHKKPIRNAFESRGFDLSPSKAGSGVSIEASAVGLIFANNQLTVGQPTPGEEVTFEMILTNQNSKVARNVRVQLKSTTSGFYETTYLQGYGDLAPGQSLQIGTQNGGIPLDYSVFGRLDRNVSRGNTIRVILEVLIDNGPTTQREVLIRL